MKRKVEKVGAVKTGRNGSRSERKLGVSCMGGLLVARVPGCCATPRIPPGRKEVAISHAYPTPGKVRNPNLATPRRNTSAEILRCDIATRRCRVDRQQSPP